MFGVDCLERLNNIKNYILFLKATQNLSISLHTIKFNSVINSGTLSPFNIHDNSYCTAIKTKSSAYEHCINCQNRAFNKCKDGPFYGICYAGVGEYVYPIYNTENCVGFISVSGYKTRNFESYINKVSKNYGFNKKELKNVYYTLKSEEKTKEYINTLILPLCDMLELAISKTEQTTPIDQPLAIKIEQYLRQHRNQNITSKDICKEFSCCRSNMSTQFNKYYGKTIREYITELRLKDAKSLLKYSNLNVTEIAFSIGFSDANYFSCLFKKAFKISPLAYRKKSR